jgi:hypothetical protein
LRSLNAAVPYELAVDEPIHLRVASAFAELAEAI